uniref:Uncharacterized protein n=1 Tax=Anguilla anguilla TaxID=7936 RepID=A0A0E9XY51_ANGAN
MWSPSCSLKIRWMKWVDPVWFLACWARTSNRKDRARATTPTPPCVTFPLSLRVARRPWLNTPSCSGESELRTSM